MRVNRSLLGWGVFFIAMGVVVLAARQGLVPADLLDRAWTLWPLLLIIGGVGVLLRPTPLEPIAGLGAAVTFGVIAGGLIAGGGVPFASCGDRDSGQAFEARTGELAADAEVQIDLLCGELTVGAQDGSGWRVEGIDDDPDGPEIEASAERLAIGADRGPSFGESRARWNVLLPTASRLVLDATVNAGEARFDLDGARLARLDASVNAGDVTFALDGVAELGGLEVAANAGSTSIALPEISVAGSIDANAGSIRLCPPPGAGLRMVFDGTLASHNFGERGLVARGDTWESPGYAAAAVKIDLEIDANAGSVELDEEGACGA